MKKIAKILIILIIIGLLINITLSRYVEEKSDISRKIGSIWSGGPISTYNYYTISKNFEYYISFLKNEDYESAYKFLPYEYRQYKNYDNYVEDARKINYTKFQVKEIRYYSKL